MLVCIEEELVAAFATGSRRSNFSLGGTRSIKSDGGAPTLPSKARNQGHDETAAKAKRASPPRQTDEAANYPEGFGGLKL
jgi:hypothetical protein